MSISASFTTTRTKFLSLREFTLAKEAKAISILLTALRRENSTVKKDDGNWESKVVRLRERLKEIESILSLNYQSNNHTTLQSLVNPHEERFALLKHAGSFDEYVAILRNHAIQNFSLKVRDVIQNPFISKEVTTHQDKKDIERDVIIINSKIQMNGHEYGYDGIVQALEDEISVVVDAAVSQELIQEKTQFRKFAKVLINAVNRTSSAGDSYEIIEKVLRPFSFGFIAPDSNSQLEPLLIDISCGSFTVFPPKSEQKNDDYEWEYGVKARVTGISKYVLILSEEAMEEEENRVVRIVAKYQREFGLNIPFGVVSDWNKVMNDDCRNSYNKELFRASEFGGILTIGLEWQ